MQREGKERGLDRGSLDSRCTTTAKPTEPGSQAQPPEISSNGSGDEPRRSVRVKRSTRVPESQQWQVEHGFIPAPGAKAETRALNQKKKITLRRLRYITTSSLYRIEMYFKLR
jgi:hypothetical protein